jgi:hypothetical protein
MDFVDEKKKHRVAKSGRSADKKADKKKVLYATVDGIWLAASTACPRAPQAP